MCLTRISVAAGLAALASLVPGELPAAERADRIFVNGKVWTGDPARPWAEAIAVRATRIIAVGSNSEIRKRAEKLSDVVDLKGRLVVPGFNDAHLHFMGGSVSLDRVDLAGVSSLEEMKRRIAEHARAHPGLAWIRGKGWAYGDFPPGGPNKKDLDAALLDRLVFLSDRDGHSAWANSAALAAAGIGKGSPDPPGGVIVRDASGQPTGVLKESAMDLVSRLFPPDGRDERYEALERGLALAASYGLTSVQDAGFDLDDLPIYEKVMAEGGLKLRFMAALPMKPDPSPQDLAEYNELRTRFHGPQFRFGAVKGFVDGVIDAKTAALLQPYASGGTGILNWTPENLNRSVAVYDRERFQVMLHAVGDKAIRMALDAFEAAARANGTKGRRHRVEHAELPDPADLPRFKALGVVASTQALFANPDKTVLDNFAVLLGPERAARADSFKLYDDAGAVQAFGSDWPVFSCDVLRGIYCAVTRMTPQGTPSGGWEPQGRISVEAALSHFTRDAAYASFDEDAKGTLTPGKLADFAVISEDVLAGPPESLLRARVLLTVMGGQDTFRRPQF
jgi:predicted amidohydrolase YtcJ